MPPFDLNAFLTRVDAAANANRRPIVAYETPFGMADRVVQDGDVYYEGDGFFVGMDEVVGQARPVFGNPGPRLSNAEAIARHGVLEPRRENRGFQQFRLDARRDALSATASFYESVRQDQRGPTIGDALAERGLLPDVDPDGRAAREAYVAIRTEHFRRAREEELILGVLDPPDSLSDWAGVLLGGLEGSLVDPLAVVGWGSTWLRRMAVTGGISAAQNAAQQGMEIARGVRRRWTPVEQIAIGRELDEIRRTQGSAAMLAALETVPRETIEAADFDTIELGMAAAFGAATQGVFEAGEGAVRAVFGPVADGFFRAASRWRIRSLGDRELDNIARGPDGAVHPLAAPVEILAATTDPWLRELAPAVERTALALDPEERAAGYGEILVRLHEAQAQGADPLELARVLERGVGIGLLPNLRGFHAVANIAIQVADGRLAADQLANIPRRLGRLTERLDPMIARLSDRTRALSRAVDQARVAADEARTAAEAARPPREAGVENEAPPRRMITDDERADIDALVEEVRARRREAREARSGRRLSEFVAQDLRGIRDDRGDIAAFNNGRAGFRSLLSERGVQLDQAIERAVEAGYFPEHTTMETLPDQRAFLSALEDDVRNIRPLHPAGADDRRGAQDSLAQMENWLERHGVDLTTRSDAALRQDIADKVYEATYGEPIGLDDAPPPVGDSGLAGASGGQGGANPSPAPQRAQPAAWGARRGGQAGGGGAMLSPQERLAAHRAPVEKNTFIRRQLRTMRRRGVTTYVRDVLSTAYTAFVEGQHPITLTTRRLVAEIEQAAGVKSDLAPSENPQLLARLARDGFSPGHLDLVDGVRPYRRPDVKGSPSFREAVETALGGKEWDPERVGRFEDYLISRRALKAWARFRRGELPRPPHAMSELDLEDAQRALLQDHPEFEQGAALLYRFLDALWEKKRDAGLITQDQFDAGRANNEDYVPFQRSLDEGVNEPDGRGAPGDRQNKRKAFQRFRGSDRKILSPLTTIMQDAYDTADRIARNESYRALVDLAARAGPFGEDIIKPLPRSFDRVQIDIADEARRAAKAAGLSEQDADAISGSIDSLLNGETARTIYRPGDVIEGGRKVIYVWREGRREAFELADPEYADDLFRALTGLTQESRDLFVDIVAAPTQMLRTAITAHPSFQTANLIRDSLSAWMLTDVGYVPGESALGAAQVLQQGDLAKLYNAVGSQGGGMIRSAMPRSHMQRDMPALRGKVLRLRNANPLEAAGALWRGFEQATELSENATRIRLFARSVGTAKRRGMSDYDAALWAAYESRDYLDFQRSGAKMLNFRRVALFLNAALQGMDRTLRTMAGDGSAKELLRPMVEMSQGRRALDSLTPEDRYRVVRAYKLWTKMALVGVFGMALTALHADDEDYQYGFSDYIKNNYWLVRAGRYWLSIPKPFDLAVVSNILERSYEATVGNDPLAWGRLVWGMADTYALPTEVTAAIVPLELINNRTRTGAPIVPMGLEDLDPHLQYTASTSQFSIQLAQGVSRWTGIEISPAQLDHIFGGTMANFFRDPARLMDAGDPDTPALTPPDLPVLNRFLREPGRGGTPVRVAFNENVMRRSGDLQRALGTLRELIERRDSAGRDAFLAQRAPFERDYALSQLAEQSSARRLHPMRRARDVMVELARIRRELGGQRPNASETFFLPDLSPRDRRIALEALDDLGAAEMQAALVMSGAPGFAGRELMDVEARYERLQTVAPSVYGLFRARLVSGRERAVDYDTIRRIWPEAQRRLGRDGLATDLSDLAGEAGADFGDVGLYQDILEGAGGRRMSRGELEEERDRALVE